MRFACAIGALLVVTGCGAMPPDERTVEPAVREYLAEHRELEGAGFFSTMNVTQLGPCATTTVDGVLVYVCPLALSDTSRPTRRAFVEVAPEIAGGWRIISFDPVEQAEK
jgi:hypothetical protein